jgi:uncharacterized membrane protein
MFVFVLYRNERFIVDPSHPDWQHYSPMRWWLLPHGLGGLVAFVAGPFQFSSRVRRQYLQLHRVSGRCYLIGVAVAVPSAIFMTVIYNTVAYRFFLLTLAAVWLLATAVAFASVLNGNIESHRQWMVRSYAITTTFVTARVLTAIPAIGGGGDAIAIPAQWALLVATMALAELGLAWRGVFGSVGRKTR